MNFSASSQTSRALQLFHRLETEGKSFIYELYETQKSEELFLDYKSVTTKPGKTLDNTDRGNLRKALSGFANSEGGVIIWGLTTSKSEGTEKIDEPKGYSDAQRFVKLIDDAVSGCTVPPTPGVRSIFIADGTGANSGFVATLIPASQVAPHQTADDKRAYLIRSGSSFQHVPHGVLAGMFGRRPNPELTLNVSVVDCSPTPDADEQQIAYVNLEVSLLNTSSALAEDAYLSWSARELGTKFSVIEANASSRAKWEVNLATLQKGSLLALGSHRLAPFSQHSAAYIWISFRGQVVEGLDLDIHYGCKGSAPKIMNFKVSKEELVHALGRLDVVQSDDNFTKNHIGLTILGLVRNQI